MKTRLVALVAFALVALAVVGRFAFAQVDFERRPMIPAREQAAQADAILTRVEVLRGQVAKQLQAAREGRDVVKVLCLNDKLTQLDTLKRTALDRRAELDAAIARADRELTDHQFTILTVQRQRAEQIATEAQQCIGAEMAFIGQTTVETTIDPNLPPDETTGGGVPVPPFPPEVTFPPVPVSPTSGP